MPETGLTGKRLQISLCPIATAWVRPGSHDPNFSNRPVRTRMPGGVAGVRLDRSLCRSILLQELPFKMENVQLTTH